MSRTAIRETFLFDDRDLVSPLQRESYRMVFDKSNTCALDVLTGQNIQSA